jgi:hypothetical protein
LKKASSLKTLDSKVLALIDHEKYVEELEKIDYVNIGNESDINSAYEIFEKSYLEVVNKHIPLKKRKPVQTPIVLDRFLFSFIYMISLLSIIFPVYF